MRKHKNLNLIIEFLKNEAEKLNDEITLDKGRSLEKIELKSQTIAAIKNLEFCVEHGLSDAKRIETIRIPEKGSDSYFTEYAIVDEGALNNVPEWAVVRNEGIEIRLNCFDLIIRTRE